MGNNCNQSRHMGMKHDQTGTLNGEIVMAKCLGVCLCVRTQAGHESHISWISCHPLPQQKALSPSLCREILGEVCAILFISYIHYCKPCCCTTSQVTYKNMSLFLPCSAFVMSDLPGSIPLPQTRLSGINAFLYIIEYPY